MTARKSTPAALRRGMTAVERLAIDVQRSTANACWQWVGPRNRWGYGRLSKGGREIMVHRVAYELANGPIPRGQVVRHVCDNPPCCNPAHLILGTARDNRMDCVARERQTRGEDCPSHVLTEQNVRDIRRRWSAGGTTFTALGAEYGVNYVTIRSAVQRKSWKHLDPPQPRVTPKGLQRLLTDHGAE